MASLSSNLISEFVKITNDTTEKPKSETTLYGTITAQGDNLYVKIDGSDQLTPVATTSTIKENDRVMVLIKDHSATVTGNVSSPSASSDDLEETNGKVDEMGSKIDEFEILIADKVTTGELDAEKARIDQLEAKNVEITGELDAAKASIDDLEASNVTITGELNAAKGDISDLKADNVTITGTLNAATASINELQADNVTIKENLSAATADIGELEADNATIKGSLSAVEADIDNLQANSLTAESADIRYAKIDFANIGEAAVENLFAKSGIIEDLVVSEGHITGELVGVTIKGDLIEGGTVKADKLVVQGSDGLYYKLNVEGESVAAEQTEYNSLNGSVITAKSITAEKVNVDDLVAFDATIGGFKITSGSLYSGVKSSVDNPTQGIYMDDTGQIVVGDDSNYLKYFKDTDGSWKLEISSDSIKMATSGTSINQTIEEIQLGLDEAIVSTVEEFYKSSLPTELNGGDWSQTQPEWTGGTYIFRRTLVTYGDGHTEYTPSEMGVCITGNSGDDGRGIESTEITYQASSSQTVVPTGTWEPTIPKLSVNESYLWTRTTIIYTDGTSDVSYSVSSTLEGIDIGSRNYFLYTEELPIDDGYDYSGSLPAQGIHAYTASTAANLEQTNEGVKYTYSGAENDGFCVPLAYDGCLEESASYIISGEIRGTVTKTGLFYFIQRTTPNVSTNSSPVVIDEANWTKIEYRIPSSIDLSPREVYECLAFCEAGEVGDWIEVRGGSLKLEKGTVATDWSPAPEDVINQIDAVNGTVDVLEDNVNDSLDSISSNLESVQDDLESATQTITETTSRVTELEQFSEGWTFNFNEIKETVTQLGDEFSTNVTETLKYIKFINGEIWLGRDPEEGEDDFKVVISNERIRFLQNNVEVAYISNNQLYITNAQVTQRLDIGNFAFFPRNNGNMTLRYVGL